MFGSIHPVSFKHFWSRRNAAPVGATPGFVRSPEDVHGLDWAGTEAALRRIGVDVPGWQLRRLQWDQGIWYCTLTLFRDVPAEFDDAVDGCDRSIARAIADAIEQARQHPIRTDAAVSRAIASTRPSEPAWCDNIY